MKDFLELLKNGTIVELADAGMDYLVAYLQDDDIDLGAIESALDVFYRIHELAGGAHHEATGL